jgi:hypothetical protein
MQTFIYFCWNLYPVKKNQDPGEICRIHNLAGLFFSYGDSSSELSFVNFLAVLNPMWFLKSFGQS